MTASRLAAGEPARVTSVAITAKEVIIAVALLLVPTLRVGTHVGTLRVPSTRPQRTSRQRRDRDGPRSGRPGVPTRSVGTRIRALNAPPYHAYWPRLF